MTTLCALLLLPLVRQTEYSFNFLGYRHLSTITQYVTDFIIAILVSSLLNVQLHRFSFALKPSVLHPPH